MRFSGLTPAAVAALACAAPACAQTDSGLTVVTGRIPYSRALGVSEPVSYADLNLNDPRDRDELALRVNNAARRICTHLNQQGPSAANLGHSCQEVAVRDAMEQVHAAFADAAASAPSVNAHGAAAGATAPDVNPH